ncbi:hypothetical protein EDB89DRAFT_1906826 [Lactarius sanguifluus]|nr:hypothetical protein EDB89DRAFT_1906826 [Lactarius sanguifluus]
MAFDAALCQWVPLPLCFTLLSLWTSCRCLAFVPAAGVMVIVALAGGCPTATTSLKNTSSGSNTSSRPRPTTPQNRRIRGEVNRHDSRQGDHHDSRQGEVDHHDSGQDEVDHHDSGQEVNRHDSGKGEVDHYDSGQGDNSSKRTMTRRRQRRTAT